MDKLKVLIVDDDVTICKVLNMAFEDEGFDVTVAMTAEEALLHINQKPFYLCILDLHLPGMSGLDLAKEIRNIHPVAILFAITGYASSFHLKECRLAGFEDYFVKPFDLGTILDAAHGALSRIERWHEMSRGVV